MSARLVFVLKLAVGLLVLAVALVWLVLSSPLFNGLRRSLVEDALSNEIGQPFVIRDDVHVRLGRIARVYVAGVEIPSQSIEGLNLAELKRLELDVDLVSLARGALEIDNLTIDGLSVNMTTAQDGTTSWTPTTRINSKAKTKASPATSSAQVDNGGGGILGFLNDKTASFSQIGLNIDNQNSGFLFDFDLSSLLLEQLENGQLVSLTSKGSVNGEAFSIGGTFPRGKPFATQVIFGGSRLDFDGQPLSAAQGGGFTGTLIVDTGEIGEVLDILRLERVLEGRGHLSADILQQVGIVKIDDINTEVSFADGALFTMNGRVENLLNTTGVDIQVEARLHPKGQPPAHAQDLKNLKLTGISASIISQGQALKFEELSFLTNAFDQGLKQVGPIRIGEVRRTPDGKLNLLDIFLQMGPLDAPYVVARGELKDALQLKGLEIAGKISGPASLLFHELPKEKVKAFGRLSADFAVSDASGNLGLVSLDAYSEDTALWSLKAHSAVPNVTTLTDLAFRLDLDIADGAEFLAALDLEPVDVGAVGLTATAEGHEENFATTVSMAVGKSQLSLAFDTVVSDGNSVVRGAVESAGLKIKDLQNGAATALALVSLSKQAGAKGKSTRDAPVDASVVGDGKVEEPLVLGAPETKAGQTRPGSDDKPEEPLVLPVAQDKPADLVHPAEMLANLDLEIGIEIKEISGPRGKTTVSSELEIKDAKARFGPLEFSYGGGYFNLNAAMDLIGAPDILTVSGATSGWDLGEILKTAGIDMDAHGKLRAQFNLAGNRKSAKAFVNSLNGSATISMKSGTVASALLELAGLGVFPWLFSAERNQGYTDIVCVAAPLRIQAGKVSSNSIVLETKSVQMVVAGALDWRKDTISIRAEPRPVGRPLARSAWPFSVTGALSKPDFNLQVGGSRVKRKDGASQSPAKRKPCTPDIRQLE